MPASSFSARRKSGGWHRFPYQAPLGSSRKRLSTVSMWRPMTGATRTSTRQRPSLPRDTNRRRPSTGGTQERVPAWCEFLSEGTVEELDMYLTKSLSAVLLIRSTGRIFAFTFGHGRYMIHMDMCVPDFGLKAVLNSAHHERLRSVDLRTLEQQPMLTGVSDEHRSAQHLAELVPRVCYQS